METEKTMKNLIASETDKKHPEEEIDHDEVDEIDQEDLEASAEVFDRLKGDDPAMKKDAGKPRYDLIDAYSLDMLARVYEFGTREYEEDDWRKGVRWGRTWGSIMRHLYAFWRGEDLEPDSGLPHLAHAVWQIFALMFYSRYGVGKDDRVNYEKLFKDKEKEGKKNGHEQSSESSEIQA